MKWEGQARRRHRIEDAMDYNKTQASRSWMRCKFFRLLVSYYTVSSFCERRSFNLAESLVSFAKHTLSKPDI